MHGIARPLLLDRLSDTGEAEPAFDQRALAASVAQELSRLLNSRSPAGNGVGILAYGIADWTALQPRREADRQHLAREIRRAVTRFEPRLGLSEVVVDADPQHPQLLRVRLLGHLRQDTGHTPLLFELIPVGGTLEVRHERLD